jgi:formate--tetrahydrofolate ligase
MSVLALSRDFGDLRRRLGRVTVGRNASGEFVSASALKADGMMAAVLKDAARPNLVQTSEGTPCFIHAGPFANVSIGTSSVIADRIALGLCDFVVTESGFGADCGAEKFFDIKCRTAGLRPAACVLVCSARGLKAQSGRCHLTPGQKIDPCLFKADLQALEEGSVNLKKQIENVRLFGVPVVVCVNVFPTDTEEEIGWIRRKALEFGAADCHPSTAWRDGSAGIMGLARSVVKIAQRDAADFKPLYADGAPLREKIRTVATRVYGAAEVRFEPAAEEMLSFCEAKGFGCLPVCIAKTQFSLSHDEALRGAPEGYVFPVREARLCSGAGFVLAFASTMQTMPGLPVEPRGTKIEVDEAGHVTGLL